MKRWIVLVLASLMLLSLCSCAEPAEESNAGVSSETQDESTPENEPAQQSSADSETGVLSHSIEKQRAGSCDARLFVL